MIFLLFLIYSLIYELYNFKYSSAVVFFPLLCRIKIGESIIVIVKKRNPEFSMETSVLWSSEHKNNVFLQNVCARW